jgi:predicted nucleic acid-binding protein
MLDVNALVGLLWNVHSLHSRANGWFARERPLVLGCTLTELSFVRVSMADRTIAASYADAERALGQFIAALGTRYRFLAAVPPGPLLQGRTPRTHKEVSDLYLCALANTARYAGHAPGSHHRILQALRSGMKG